ncbi:MAG TPA: site-specific tyrosine recombinase XerC [Terriglobales bacterium]|nr:site-specific tyrosine recombinase XerC [Terriglobales bacterium]
MARPGRKKRTSYPAPTNPLEALLAEYLNWTRVKNCSEVTVRNRRVHIGFFLKWCNERGLLEPVEITRPVLERYQRYLFHYRKKNGQPLSFHSQHSRLVPIRVWFRWMARQNYLLHNPASEIELPRLGFHLPRHVLSVAEAEQVLQQPEIHDPLGLRDRAILETFYSTGIRRLELINLQLYDLDMERGIVIIRQGKGKKDRVIPIGDRAVAWVEKYLRESRPQLVVEPDKGVLFLTNDGEPLSRDYLTWLARTYIAQSKIGKTGACHLFRHTMATLMLENGADIRFIQQMLGHSKLSTTQIYTQVSIRMLKQVHTATHPAQLHKPAAPAAANSDQQRAALWTALDAEAQEEKEA